MCLVYNNKGSFVKSKCRRPNTWFEFPPRAALRFVDNSDWTWNLSWRHTPGNWGRFRLSFTIRLTRKVQSYCILLHKLSQQFWDTVLRGGGKILWTITWENEPASRYIPLPTLRYRIRLSQLKYMRVCHDMWVCEIVQGVYVRVYMECGLQHEWCTTQNLEPDLWVVDNDIL